jgi:hypothetical protein
MARTLTFRVPDAMITLSDRDVDALVSELDELDMFEHGPGRQFGEAAKVLRSATRRFTRRQPIELEPGADAAVTRALDHLRGRPGFSQPLSRLRDALLANLAPSTVTYDLELHHADGRIEHKTFFSYTGSYEVGEPLPPDENYETWIVMAAKPATAATDRPTLVVEPPDDEQ